MVYLVQNSPARQTQLHSFTFCHLTPPRIFFIQQIYQNPHEEIEDTNAEEQSAAE
jgi:hypothetical protein